MSACAIVIIIIIIIFFFIPLVVKIPGVKKKLKTDVSNMEWSEVGVVVQDKRLWIQSRVIIIIIIIIKNECHSNIIVDRLQGCSHSKKLRLSESESRSSKVVWQARCQL